MSEKWVAPPGSDSGCPPAGISGAAPHEGQPQAQAQLLPELECSVGIMAYNEEANIAHALDSILRQELTGKQIREVIVVASGCQDRTADIVADIASRERRVRLIEQERREGKASAINLFIGEAKCPVLVMVSADLIVEDGAFDFLLRHFEDSAVGMVGGHPIPVNGRGTFLGHAVHLQWSLHDRIARHSPKLGEVVAFRNVVPSIPLDTAVDELSIQALITQLGFRLVYEPRAVVYNRGPATVQDFLRQRRRIYAGHLRIREQQAYSAPTMSAWRAGRALLGAESFSIAPGGHVEPRHRRARGQRPGPGPLRRRPRPPLPPCVGNVRYDEAAYRGRGWCTPSAQRRGVPHRELPPPGARDRAPCEPPARSARGRSHPAGSRPGRHGLRPGGRNGRCPAAR